eukprot:SAG11_NODE_968_length_6354_cov_16.546922_4_plen_83_part_00
MVREHGDLSSDVADPKTDWAEKGVTWQAMKSMEAALQGGASAAAEHNTPPPYRLVLRPEPSRGWMPESCSAGARSFESMHRR